MKKQYPSSAQQYICCFVLFLALPILCSSCCSPLQPIPEGVEVVPLTQHPLFPLETGRFWVYKTYSYWYDGGINSDKLLYVDSSESVRIVMCDTLVRYNNKIYRAVVFNSGRETPFWSDTNEVAYFTTLSITPGTSYFRKFLQYPIQQGDTFNIRRVFAPSGEIQVRIQPIECIGTNEDIYVPAGNFICYGFQFYPGTYDGHSLTNVTNIDYYAPGIGLVKSLITNGSLDRVKSKIYARSVLIRYGSFRNP